MREAVALEHGIALYRQYGEEQAAHYIGCDHTTVKRWRRASSIPHVNLGNRMIRYFGWQIVDILLLGKDKCLNIQSVISNAGNIGSPKTESHQPTTAHGTTRPLDKPAVQALAQMTFPKPKRG